MPLLPLFSLKVSDFQRCFPFDQGSFFFNLILLFLYQTSQKLILVKVKTWTLLHHFQFSQIRFCSSPHYCMNLCRSLTQKPHCISEFLIQISLNSLLSHLGLFLFAGCLFPFFRVSSKSLNGWSNRQGLSFLSKSSSTASWILIIG